MQNWLRIYSNYGFISEGKQDVYDSNRSVTATREHQVYWGMENCWDLI
jgi:hypothetical protein